eukprot:s4170_g4.t1
MLRDYQQKHVEYRIWSFHLEFLLKAPTAFSKVSTCNRDLKPEDAAKQRREIEAETKDAATGYLQKHGIEDKLAECLRTMLRMKPEDPVEFMRGGDPEAVTGEGDGAAWIGSIWEPPAPVAPAPVEAAAVPVAPAAPKTEMVEETKPEVPAAPPAPPVEENRPQVKPEAPAEQAVTVETPKPVESQPEARFVDVDEEDPVWSCYAWIQFQIFVPVPRNQRSASGSELRGQLLPLDQGPEGRRLASTRMGWGGRFQEVYTDWNVQDLEDYAASSVQTTLPPLSKCFEAQRPHFGEIYKGGKYELEDPGGGRPGFRWPGRAAGCVIMKWGD